MMEAIRIRREGYALREDHQSFFNRFSVLLGSDDVKGTVGIEQLVTVLSARLNVTDADWQIGHTKIFLRRELSDKLERLARLRVHRAARTVGRFGRNIARRQSGAFIVIWMRFRLVMIKFRRTQRAASKIASTYKMHVQYKIYMNAIKAVIKIQSQFRKCSAVRRARKLRDPYCDLTYRDIKKLLNTKKLQMEEAIKAKDFQRAATVESVIDALTISMERKQPMTRSRLDEKIAVSQSKLDDALQRKAYKEAGPLQDEVEKLTALRSEYPTVDELKLNLAHAEQAVAEAARKRDFKSAATLQATADKAKRRLEEAYVDEGFDEEIKTNLVEAKNGISVETNLSVDGVSSRGDLEHQISAIHCQIEEAIAKKDFKLASSLQEKVNKKEKLRFLFPSIDELELKLKSARGKLGDAISSKDFAAAGKLHEEIDELEKMVELEKSKLIASPRNASDSDAATVISTDGSKLTFSSRFDLEEEIKLKKKAQSEEVSARNFKQAQQIQNLIEKLESLREKLPTAAELRRKISDLKGMMNGAIAEKRFVDAERIDLDIQVLEGRLKIEAENEPKSDTHIPSTSTAKVPIQVPGMGIAKSHSSDFSVRSTPILKKRATNTIDGPNTVVGGTPNVRKLNLAPPASVPRSKHFRDDLSDVTSGRSTTTEKKSQMSQKISSCLQSHSEIDRRVSKLRPKKPLISQQNDTALAVAKMMAAKRASSCLVVDSSKSLAGIVTGKFSIC
jgi:myosin heavy subunit